MTKLFDDSAGFSDDLLQGFVAANRVVRARPLAERSVGTPDAEAASMAMTIPTVADELGRQEA